MKTLIRISSLLVFTSVLFVACQKETSFEKGNSAASVGSLSVDASGNCLDPTVKDYLAYTGVASLSGNGYSSFLHGCVVDMLYFPIFDATLPKWFPFWGGEQFEFFSPIFNIADASISVGVITLLLFQKEIF